MTTPAYRILPWLAAVLASAGSSAFAARPIVAEAQRETADRAVPQFRRGVARAEAGGTPDSAPLEVLGHGSEFGEQAILRRRAHVEPWSASLEALAAHTDNAALSPVGRRRDWYLRLGVNLGYTNRIAGPFFLDVALAHSLFRYAEFDALDFDHTRLEAGALLQAPWLDDAFFFARYSYERIGEADAGLRLYDSHSVVLGVQKIWKISRGQQLFAGLSADLALTADPSASQRDEYALVLGYSARLTQRFSAQLSYRLAHYRYDEVGRADWNQIGTFGLTYDLLEWLRLAATASYSRNTSDRSFAEYENFVTGAALSLRAAF